jgi:hypothetical protein
LDPGEKGERGVDNRLRAWRPPVALTGVQKLELLPGSSAIVHVGATINAQKINGFNLNVLVSRQNPVTYGENINILTMAAGLPKRPRRSVAGQRASMAGPLPMLEQSRREEAAEDEEGLSRTGSSSRRRRTRFGNDEEEDEAVSPPPTQQPAAVPRAWGPRSTGNASSGVAAALRPLPGIEPAAATTADQSQTPLAATQRREGAGVGVPDRSRAAEDLPPSVGSAR